MDDSVDNLVLEHLHAIRSDISDVKSAQRHTNERLAAIEHHLAGFHITVANHTDEIEDIRHRIERIERRLEISDSPTNLQ